MSDRLLLALVAGLVIASSGAARADDGRCRQLVHQALTREAARPRPAFTSYSETTYLEVDRVPLEQLNVGVTYRSDGVAVVDDSWSQPWITQQLEPGPPLLGPFHADGNDWALLGGLDSSLPLIASVKTSALECTIVGTETYDNRNAVHVIFPDAPADRNAIKAFWIDPQTLDVLKLVVNGRLNVEMDRDDKAPHFADFQVELEQIDGYTVVRHVTWQLDLRGYGQVATYFGEYYYKGYSFSDRSPSGLLATLK